MGPEDRMILSKTSDWPYWFKCLEWHLKGEALWDLVSGSATKPAKENAAAVADYKKNQVKACLVIAKLVDKKYGSILMACGDDPEEMLKSLKAQFGQAQSVAQRISWREQLHSMSQAETESFDEYLFRFNDIKVKMADSGITYDDEEACATLLRGLASRFDSARSALRMRGGDLKFDDMVGLLRTEEIHLMTRGLAPNASQAAHATASVAKGHRKFTSSRGKTHQVGARSCEFCGRPNHNKDECNKRKRLGDDVTCRKCGTKGHLQDACRNGKRNPPQASSQAPNQRPATTGGSRLPVGTFASVCVVSGSTTQTMALRAGGGDMVRALGVDSAATENMFLNQNDFTSLEEMENPVSVTLGDGEKVLARYRGEVRLRFNLPNGESYESALKNALYVPGLVMNLISVSKLEQNGYCITFSNKACQIVNSTGLMVASGHLESSGLYFLDAEILPNPTVCVAATMPTWHYRMGHAGLKVLQKMVERGSVKDMKIKGPQTLDTCEDCAMGKSHRQPHFDVEVEDQPDECLQVVHSDVRGPMEVAATDGSIYMVTFVDGNSRFGVTDFLKNKSEVFDKLKIFSNWASNFHQRKIGCLRSDNGGEYVSKEMISWLADNGIQHELTVPGTPEQNGLAERFNRTVFDKALSMMAHAKAPKSLWTEAVRYAGAIHNRLPSSVLPEAKTPYEIWKGKKPDLEMFKVFGCRAYVHVPDSERQKLDPKAKLFRFVGVADLQKAFRLQDMETGKIICRYDVTFDEERFDFERDFCRDQEKFVERPVLMVNEREKRVRLIPTRLADDQDELRAIKAENAARLQAADDKGKLGSIVQQMPLKPPDPEPAVVEQVKPPVVNVTPIAVKIEKPRKVPNELAGLQFDAGVKFRGAPEGAKRQSNPPNKFSSGSNGQANTAFAELVAALEQQHPLSHAEAMAGEDKERWQAAEQSEIQSFIDNEAFEETELPKDEKLLGTLWVLTKKLDESGNLDRLKARLVVQGYGQQKGIDFLESYAPVLRLASFRTLLAMAAAKGWHVHQMDVQTAYLNSEIRETVYVRPPPGYAASGKVWRLKKAVYGLPQAGRAWYELLSSFLIGLGFTQLEADPCVFVRGDLVIAVYVDDLGVMGVNEAAILEVKGNLCDRFRMKDLGVMAFCLGINVVVDENGITIHQRQYIERLLQRYQMEEANGIDTPFAMDTKLVKDDGVSRPVDQRDYQSWVGSYLYATGATRLDSAHCVSVLARFNGEPNESHLTAAKRLLRFLKTTADVGIRYKRGNFEIKAYTDADWAGDDADSKSTSGYVLMMAGGAVDWISKKQEVVAKSTMEAELVALNTGVQSAIWSARLIAELTGYEITIPFFCDNQAAIATARNGVVNRRTKHMRIRVHFVQDQLKTGAVTLEWIGTDLQLADLLTKPMGKQRHYDLMEKLGCVKA